MRRHPDKIPPHTQTHTQTHSIKVNVHPCKRCSARFASAKSLQDHYMRRHPDNVYTQAPYAVRKRGEGNTHFHAARFVEAIQVRMCTYVCI